MHACCAGQAAAACEAQARLCIARVIDCALVQQGVSMPCGVQVEELQQNLLELVDNQAVPVLGRGKSIAQKGYAQKGQLGLRR